jgi:hypothetical protein
MGGAGAKFFIAVWLNDELVLALTRPDYALLLRGCLLRRPAGGHAAPASPAAA